MPPAASTRVPGDALSTLTAAAPSSSGLQALVASRAPTGPSVRGRSEWSLGTWLVLAPELPGAGARTAGAQAPHLRRRQGKVEAAGP